MCVCVCIYLIAIFLFGEIFIFQVCWIFVLFYQFWIISSHSVLQCFLTPFSLVSLSEAPNKCITRLLLEPSHSYLSLWYFLYFMLGIILNLKKYTIFIIVELDYNPVLFSFYSYYKIMARFPVLYDIYLSYSIVYTSLSPLCVSPRFPLCLSLSPHW